MNKSPNISGKEKNMQFYKILRQNRKDKSETLYNLLDVKKHEYIKGNNPNSIAISYNPENYNQLLNDSTFFNEFTIRSIQQLYVTNQKFLTILGYDNHFKMNMIDCEFTEDSNNDYLEEYDELNLESIKDIVSRYEFNIKEITYRTIESRRKIVLQKNGVIGIDNGLTNTEYNILLDFIDTLNFGLKVIKK